MLGFLRGFAHKGVSMIILQVLRVFTLIGLATVMASAWVLAVKINMSKPYFVFDAASLVFMSGIALFLALSELPFAFSKDFFRAHWPAFSSHCGLGWLGLALIMIGCNTMGKLNNSAAEPDDIGKAWWQLVLASGILNLVFGVLNVLATFALHDYTEGKNVRVVRSDGADDTEGSLPYLKSEGFSGSGPYKKPKRAFFGFGRRDSGKEQSRPTISNPISAHNDLENNQSAQGDDYDHSADGHIGRPSAVSSLSREDHHEPQRSPINPEVQRPNDFDHPYNRRNTGGPGIVVRATSSVYDDPPTTVVQFK
ncbi:hypothetical protein ACO1O0_007472 [Amphichorda felina]